MRFESEGLWDWLVINISEHDDNNTHTCNNMDKYRDVQTGAPTGLM